MKMFAIKKIVEYDLTYTISFHATLEEAKEEFEFIKEQINLELDKTISHLYEVDIISKEEVEKFISASLQQKYDFIYELMDIEDRQDVFSAVAEASPTVFSNHNAQFILTEYEKTTTSQFVKNGGRLEWALPIGRGYTSDDIVDRFGLSLL